MTASRHLEHPGYLAVFLAVGAAALVAMCASPLWPEIGIGDGATGLVLGLAFWTVLGLVASSVVIHMHGGTNMDVATAPLLAATILGGPLGGGIVGFLGTFQVREFRSGIPRYAVFANHLTIALPAAASGLVMGYMGLRGAEPTTALVISGIGGITQIVLNKTCSWAMIWCRNGHDASSELTSTIMTDLSTGAVGALMAQMCLRAGVWTTILFAPLLLVVRDALTSSQLSQSNIALEAAVRTDVLTGLGNRLRLNEDLVSLSAALSRSGRHAGVVILDLDHFKALNDMRGHLAGDEALRAAAAALREASRAGDRIYRYGGEEFLVLTDDGDLDGTAVLASRLVEAVAGVRIPHLGNSPHNVVTISAGIAMIGPQGPEQVDLALREADEALYAAKDAGRNQVCRRAA